MEKTFGASRGWRCVHRDLQNEHAIELGDRTICYADLEHRVEAVVKRLAELGVQRGDVVAIHLPNGIPIVVLIHAGFIGDFVVLPINTRLTAKEIEFQLLDSGTRFLVHAHDDFEAERIELDGKADRIRIGEVDDILQLVLAQPTRPPWSTLHPLHLWNHGKAQGRGTER